jgi:predicted Zn-dependent protease
MGKESLKLWMSGGKFTNSPLRERDMKRTWVKVVALTLALALCGAGVALGAKKADKPLDIGKALLDSYDLIEKKQYKKADALLDKILVADPGNPLALNNKASVMVAEKKFDKADTYLNQALPKAKGYMVQVNRVCSVGNICLAFKPVTGGTGNQDLEPLIKMNIEMVKGYMTSGPLPGKGLR